MHPCGLAHRRRAKTLISTTEMIEVERKEVLPSSTSPFLGFRLCPIHSQILRRKWRWDLWSLWRWLAPPWWASETLNFKLNASTDRVTSSANENTFGGALFCIYFEFWHRNSMPFHNAIDFKFKMYLSEACIKMSFFKYCILKRQNTFSQWMVKLHIEL